MLCCAAPMHFVGSFSKVGWASHYECSGRYHVVSFWTDISIGCIAGEAFGRNLIFALQRSWARIIEEVHKC